MNYSLNIGEWNSVFAVPSSVVDRYIRLASGNSLKLLLFLLRHGGECFTESGLCEELDFKEVGEIEDAAAFWVQRGIISLHVDGDGQCLSACKASNAPIEKAEIADEKQPSGVGQLGKSETIVSNKAVRISPTSVSSGEIASRISTDKNVKVLFEEAEKLYARPLRQRDNQTVIALVDHYGLDVGVSLMLLQYCRKVDKLTPAYISSVAADWSENGIFTIEKAEDRVRSLEKQNGIEERLREALGMETDFTTAQKKYFSIWIEDWGFGEEMLLLAINKTIEQIGKPKLNYTNKILENWKKDGITTPEQADNPSVPRPADANSSFDKNDVMANILKRYKV